MLLDLIATRNGKDTTAKQAQDVQARMMDSQLRVGYRQIPHDSRPW